MASLKFAPEESVVEYRLNRLYTLRKCDGPSDLIEMEERTVDFITGAAYQSEVLLQDDYEQLREKLVCLFISWSSAECYFKYDDVEWVKKHFAKSSIPVDANKEKMVPNIWNVPVVIEGYLSPDAVNDFSPHAVKILDAADPETDISYSDYFERAAASAYGVYYSVEFNKGSSP